MQERGGDADHTISGELPAVFGFRRFNLRGGRPLRRVFDSLRSSNRLRGRDPPCRSAASLSASSPFDDDELRVRIGVAECFGRLIFRAPVAGKRSRIVVELDHDIAFA